EHTPSEEWSILEGSGIMRTVFHIIEKEPDAKDRLKIVTDLCSTSVAKLARRDSGPLCKKLLPDDVGDFRRRYFKEDLEHAARSAWFNQRIQSHGVVNMGVPLRALLLLAMEGREAADSHLRKAGVTDEDFIQDILSTDQDTLTTLADNFGWLVHAGEFFKEAGKDCMYPLWLGLEDLKSWTAKNTTSSSPSDGKQEHAWCTGCYPVYVDGRVQAVVLRLPTWNTDLFSPIRGKPLLTSLPFGDLSVRGLRPTTYGLCPMPDDPSDHEELGVMTFVLTQDRADMLTKVARSCLSEEQGTMLTGPRGVGKSALLQTLAMIIGIGAGGDVMYLPRSSVLVPSDPDFAALPHRLMHGGFSLSCGPAVRSPKVCHDIASIDLEGADAHRALSRLFVDGQASFVSYLGFHRPDVLPTGLIIDDADVVQTLLREEPKQHQEWCKLLRWLFRCGVNSSRVFAYAPDFHVAIHDRRKNYYVQKMLRHRLGLEKENAFVELKGVSPKLAHMLMLGQTELDDTPAPTQEIATAADLPAGVDCDLQLPAFALKELDWSPSMDTFRSYVESVGSAAPRLSTELRQQLASSRMDYEDFVGDVSFSYRAVSVWRGIRDEMEERCFRELSSSISVKLLPVGGYTSHVFQRCMSAASMIVRDDRNQIEVGRKHRYVSEIAAQAFVRALARRHGEAAGDHADEECRQNWEFLLKEIPRLHYHSADHFDMVAALVELGMFGSEYTHMSTTPSRKPSKLLCSYSDKSSLKPALRYYAPQALQGKGLSAKNVDGVQGLNPGEVYRVNTRHIIPGLDFVVFRRPEDEEDQASPAKLQIAFVLPFPPPPRQRAPEPTWDARHLNVEPGCPETWSRGIPTNLHSITALACPLNYASELGDKEVTIRDSTTIGRDTTTLANAILWAFGVPIDLNCRVKCNEEERFERIIMEPRLLAPDQRSRVHADTWRLLRPQRAAEGVEPDLPLTQLITDVGDVELFFVHYSPHAKHHFRLKPEQVDVPGCFGVFGTGFLPPEMRSLDKKMPELLDPLK
ncbi:unnamed protein product, partial [Symbiodinium sp. KB8]